MVLHIYNHHDNNVMLITDYYYFSKMGINRVVVKG